MILVTTALIHKLPIQQVKVGHSFWMQARIGMMKWEVIRSQQQSIPGQAMISSALCLRLDGLILNHLQPELLTLEVIVIGLLLFFKQANNTNLIW